jgi:hypothetical protein
VELTLELNIYMEFSIEEMRFDKVSSLITYITKVTEVVGQ